MRKFFLTSLILITLLTLPGGVCGNEPVSSREKFRQKIDAVISSSWEINNSNLGVCITIAKSKKEIYERNAGRPMIPASNLKILISSAALELLGPEYRYTTAVYGPPPRENSSVMDGNLYLWSNGDPTMTEDELKGFALKLKENGIKHIKGDVVGDDSYFDRDHSGIGWKSRYTSLEYAAQCSSLSLCRNIITLKIEPNKTQFTPACSIISIKNNTRPAGYSEVSINRTPGTNEIVLTGCVGWGDSLVDTVTVEDPAKFTTFAFARILKENGITISGKTRLIYPTEEGITFSRMKYAEHNSPPLADMIKDINKESDNFYSQQVFRSLGARMEGKGTRENSIAVIKEFLNSHDVDTTSLEIADGCGLSEMNRCSARQFVGLLTAMFHGWYGQEFMDSLPAGGEGTLEYRLHNIPVRAKTGSLLGHSTLSGYVVTAGGQTLTFSILVNDFKASNWDIHNFQDRLVKTMANWKYPL
ncbi:MAG: D-alanyl-D-alanine carboxypeptidase/D-alanyl-D-alanine-endopeptidase [Chloroflexi bacterium]|nr:D-alanyl-D-alanine carboxypeptidase/D-alanyl-D-alanine-endopeptidase [Chloroflexota bacterium]